VKAAGVPVVPGSDGLVKDPDEALRLANEIGYPVLVKAAAGGGGKSAKMTGFKDPALRNSHFFLDLINAIKLENPHLWTSEFRAEIKALFLKAVELEYRYAEDTMPRGVLGMNASMFKGYLRYIANRRATQIGLEPLFPNEENPFPWMSEVIDLKKENRGKERIAGLDLGAKLGGLKTSWGEFGLRLNGTLTLKSERQTGDGDPFISNLGVFINDGVVQRWRHSLSLDWESGPFSATLSNSYLQGYDDQHIIGKPDRKVGAYSLWNLSGGWDVTKALTLRAGVQNLANTAPPFSQQAWFFISGYDPSYTDSRGRFVYASVKYTFR